MLSSKSKKSKDNKYILVGCIFILSVFTFVIFFLSNSYALNDFGTVTISCDKSKVIKNDIINCSITGNIIQASQISSLEMRVDISNNLEILSFSKDSSWEGDGEDGNIQLYTENNKEETFAIGMLQVKVKNNVYNEKEKIELKNVVFYQGTDNNYDGESIEGLSVEFDTPTITFNNINVKKEKNALYKIPISTTAYSILDNIDVEGNKILKNKKNQVLSENDLLKTGDTLTISVDNETIDYKVSILGDTTGDGVLLINDVGKVYQYLKGKIIMDDECILAGEVTKDGEIQINDVGKMYQFLKGKINSLD